MRGITLGRKNRVEGMGQERRSYCAFPPDGVIH